jgi:3-hydroxyacyl-[acyl-carrier-protein] dehydratase
METVNLPITEKSVLENLIPQKHPFVMVDKLLEFSENYIAAGLQVQNDNIFTKDTLFQEAGLIEHMAQAVALYTGYQYFLKNQPAPTGYIGSVKNAEIIKLPKTGDELVTRVKVLQEFGGVTLVDISTIADGNLIATSQMKTIIAQ